MRLALALVLTVLLSPLAAGSVAGALSEVPCAKGGEAWELLFILDKISISP